MENRSIWKGIVAGAIGGLAATYVMTEFQNAWAATSKKLSPEGSKDEESSSDDPATVKAADKLLAVTSGSHVPDDKKETVGNLVHYGFGTLAGVTYGLLAELLPQARTGFGSLFGSLLFIAADEIGVPAAGLSKAPTEIPAKVHLYAWTSHVVYGTALEASRRATRAALDKATGERGFESSRFLDAA